MSEAHGLPVPAQSCRVTVCVPARNEASLIERTLIALCEQRDRDGRPLPRGSFDIIVVANNCRDATADIVRGFARRMTPIEIFTIEAVFDPADAHIGTARRYVMDLAATRYLAAGRPDGIIASIDSDTIADADWIAGIVHGMRSADAVAGQVTIAATDYNALLAPVRLLYARELTYRRVLAEVEGLIDPEAADPNPRHGSFVGASFAVSASTYVTAGRIPPLARLEDLAFAHALRRIDARVRHSTLVRASTSARLRPRVAGGFGTFLADLHAQAERGESFTVEHAQRSLDDLFVRAALRKIRDRVHQPGDIERVARVLNTPASVWRTLLDPAAPFGISYEAISAISAERRRPDKPQPVEIATVTLREAAALARTRHGAGTAVDMLARRGAG